ncbi:MAG: hypothetical protein EDM05_051440 [Leptolyngbya sp. IPPAS B-1204]|nr:hypothetical protein [Elainella sp. C42_A2020_010]
MTHNPSRPSMFPFQAQAELELLQLMLQGEPIQYPCEPEESYLYPWNPIAPEADAYFDALEEEIVKAGWSVEELAEQGQRLSNYLEQVWSAPEFGFAPATQTTADTACVHLLQQFAAQVPQQLLETIARRARQVMTSNLSLADQMVQCVQECLPNWAEEDLQVLARPFAYAMRGTDTEMLEAALRSVRCAAWTELSGIEQARLSLAIARYAIAQMPADAE